ncbi:hypothetical protein [Desulfuribacillus stibiiarsenatis]|nr:hypothetical protein [Desulfuribacillus stibiiarsenatis]
MKYLDHIQPLEVIAEKTEDSVLREVVLEAIIDIKNDPHERNLKWDVD